MITRTALLLTTVATLLLTGCRLPLPTADLTQPAAEEETAEPEADTDGGDAEDGAADDGAAEEPAQAGDGSAEEPPRAGDGSAEEPPRAGDGSAEEPAGDAGHEEPDAAGGGGDDGSADAGSHAGDGGAAEGSTDDLSVYTPISGCAEGDVVPLGQAPGAVNFEPLGSIWCFELRDPPARTAVEGANSWVDDFTVDTLMLRLDEDMGYRVYDRAGQSPGRSQHWINQNHWMVDAKGAFTGGASMRPDRAFTFEDGTFVVEADFAASMAEYGDTTWGEITITSAPQPTGVIADSLYAYGQFGGHWAVGCRLQSSRVPVCAVEGPRPNSPPSDACSSIRGAYRVAEMSFWQRCGSRTMGGGPWGTAGEHWRECGRGAPDMGCRDRFRMEVTKSSITLYVNGVKYFEDAGWPAAHQLPDSFVDGDVYAYQSEWQVRAGSRAYRYHWDHFAVNPPGGPTASPLFP